MLIAFVHCEEAKARKDGEQGGCHGRGKNTVPTRREPIGIALRPNKLMISDWNLESR